MEYKAVKVGKLKLKGEKVKKHKKRKRPTEEEGGGAVADDVAKQDTADHGGWWRTSAPHQVRDSVAVQVGRLPHYICARDDGTFSLGDLHDQGEGPSPPEVLAVVPCGDGRRVALKSGYGKYVSVDGRGALVGRAEAVGPREMWTPVYQDGSAALLSATECFVGVEEDESITATSATVSSDLHRLTLRCSYTRDEDKEAEVPQEEQGTLSEVELKHIRKFQKFQDKRVRVNPSGHLELREAKEEGRMHEALLDRRSKMKADRYCK